MGLMRGALEIANVMRGASQVDVIFRGTQEVWSANKYKGVLFASNGSTLYNLAWINNRWEPVPTTLVMPDHTFFACANNTFYGAISRGAHAHFMFKVDSKTMAKVLEVGVESGWYQDASGIGTSGNRLIGYAPSPYSAREFDPKTLAVLRNFSGNGITLRSKGCYGCSPGRTLISGNSEDDYGHTSYWNLHLYDLDSQTNLGFYQRAQVICQGADAMPNGDIWARWWNQLQINNIGQGSLNLPYTLAVMK